MSENRFRLMNVPEAIKILDKDFIIAGAIVFIPPIMDGDIGHYVCAIKMNNQWVVYDDNDSKSPKNKSSAALILIHALMYVVPEN